jgi:hypothetical protein
MQCLDPHDSSSPAHWIPLLDRSLYGPEAAVKSPEGLRGGDRALRPQGEVA